jgi:hypothetical protein
VTINHEGHFLGLPIRRDFSFSNFVRTHDLCSYCFKAPGDKKFTFDHVIAKNAGGLDKWHNRAVACEPCNKAKSDKGVLHTLLADRHKALDTWVYDCHCKTCSGRRKARLSRHARAAGVNSGRLRVSMSQLAKFIEV